MTVTRWQILYSLKGVGRMAESHSQNMFRNSVGSIALCMALTSAAGCNAPATVVADDSSETEEPAGEPDHANLLIHETSPYLLQHAHNPVNWHPWGPEAFAKAKKEGKPIFLSVGYSTCYWCHVMERQSFEKQDVADILNKHFIPIKVDREERPDVDEQYMLATQIVTGRGGWPNSVWLTPDGQPWMAGTYFPREQFKTLLTRLADIWETRRDDVDQQADRLTELMQTAGDVDAIGLAQPPTPELLEQAITEIVESFDEQHGGFGDAPKFPPHGQLRLLVHEYQRTNDTRLLDIIRRTLDAMQAGGIRDHLGGGFHRYSTDRYWLLPHFEKMLYDNAQLMRAYTDGYLLTRDDRYRLVVADISEWLQRKMTSPEGAFYSAIDSESEQEEGRFYVWRKDEIIDELGTDDGELFSTVYGVRSDGNFRDEATGEKSENNILHLPQPLDEIAAKLNLDEQQLPHRLHDLNTRMLNLRGQRVSPHLDDKILVAWNALMIESLAYSGRQLERPEYTTAAAKAAEFVLLQMTRDGRLLRSWRAGQAKQPAFLDDYAFFASALIELHLATGDEHWLTDARRIADLILTEFQDAQHGGFYFTSSEHPDRLARSRNLMGGGNIPSGNGVAAQVLLRLDAIESTPGHRDAALRTLHTLSPVMWRSPSGADSLMLALADAVKAGILPADRGHQSEPDEAAVDSFDDPPIRGRVFADERNVTPGQSLEIRVVLDIDDGWHLYGPNPAADFLIESTVELLPSGSITIKSIERPAGVRKDDALAGQELLLYAGRAHWLVTLDVAEAAAEKDVTLEFQVTTQACDQERCLPPKKNQLHLPLRIRRVAESNTAN